MDLSKTLTALDSMLSAPTLTPMTKAQFEAYAADQMTKAKAEAEEGDDGKEKAKKRLAHLRATVATLTKAEGTPITGAWTGDNGTALIPEFDHGFEDTTRKTEISETETQTPPAGNSGTQGDSTIFSGASPGFDQQAQGGAASGTTVPGSGQGTQNDNTIFEQGAVGKALKDLQGVLAPLTKTTPAAPAKAPPAVPGYEFPADMAQPEYLKDGVAKRAGDHWGRDTEKSAK